MNMFKNIFKYRNIFEDIFKEPGVKHVITLFHAPKSPNSVRVYTLLKQANGNAAAHATEDQASDHTKQSKMEMTEFTLDIQEKPPTSDQLSNILECLGPSSAGTVVKDATGASDALRIFKAHDTAFIRPVVVNWSSGRAVAGDNPSEIMKLVRSLPDETEKV